jgi:hypothetical protein
MRLLLLALLAFSLPTWALAAAPVTREQCAPTTVKMLQEGHYKEVAELFSSAKEAPHANFNEVVAKLTGNFSVLGALSNTKPIVRMPDGNTFKLEVADVKPLLASEKFSRTVHSMHSAVGGDVFLELSYRMDQPNCALIAVAVHLPRTDSGHSAFSLIYETTNDANARQFEALLKEKKITQYKVDKASLKGKPGLNWTVTTLPFSIPGGTEAIKPYMAPFFELDKKKPGQLTLIATATFSSSDSAKP